ncbi:hypothetical protein IHE45_12G001000 [Dioscorea alata]|uniref:Uncharacterized protein n=1 Tax=Dioscorea alata TaxID=55571 RepID=A0ACB7UZV7_DIOAL|nr:hypothetical protein IHE45_12G001000 [Dioscorea alata]
MEGIVWFSLEDALIIKKWREFKVGWLVVLGKRIQRFKIILVLGKSWHGWQFFFFFFFLCGIKGKRNGEMRGSGGGLFGGGVAREPRKWLGRLLAGTCRG